MKSVIWFQPKDKKVALDEIGSFEKMLIAYLNSFQNMLHSFIKRSIPISNGDCGHPHRFTSQQTLCWCWCGDAHQGWDADMVQSYSQNEAGAPGRTQFGTKRIGRPRLRWNVNARSLWDIQKWKAAPQNKEDWRSKLLTTNLRSLKYIHTYVFIIIMTNYT